MPFTPGCYRVQIRLLGIALTPVFFSCYRSLVSLQSMLLDSEGDARAKFAGRGIERLGWPSTKPKQWSPP